MIPKTTKYDVAISFLARDQGTVGAIAESLTETLKVFYFPRAQEALAGTDGLEFMRIPFVSGSRLTVVFFREPWGETEWTRLEELSDQGWMPEARLEHSSICSARQDKQAANLASRHPCSIRL